MTFFCNIENHLILLK